jgi:glutathione-regulated potassium-efflux system ancillary protein KefC
MMLVEGISCTILDHDAEMVEAACSFGFRVFYGDASRLHLLRTAGSASAGAGPGGR